MKIYKALTKDSKTKQDFKEVAPTKTYSDIAQNKKHVEFYCKGHMKTRLINYCHQDTLVDVIFSGTDLIFRTMLQPTNISCQDKKCELPAEFRIDRLDTL